MDKRVSFEEAWAYAEKIEGWFAEIEARKVWDLASDCVEKYGIMEIGCYKGRSTSILAHFLKGTGLSLVLVDPFVPRDGQTTEMLMRELLCTIDRVGTPYTLIPVRTILIRKILGLDVLPIVDFLHVDGQHDEDGIRADCEVLLSFVRSGGWACFHDYGNPGWPAIKVVVDEYLKDWEAHGTTGLLHYARKP